MEGEIPRRYTCDGENIDPSLEWSDVPESVKSFALIVEDPDAPLIKWAHWIVYDVPENVRKTERVAKLYQIESASIYGTYKR